ncbi:hypothetical protein BGX34_011444, partial [Mortierella sp. NVP85]
MSLNSQLQQEQHEAALAAEWTMDKVVQWLRGKSSYEYLIPLFLEHQIHGKAFASLSHTTLKTLDPTGTYFQRRVLLLEIKDAIDGTKSATSVSSMGSDNNSHTPSPASASTSPTLNRLGSGSRSPYANPNSSNSTIYVGHPTPPDPITVRTMFDDSSQYNRFTRSPVEETPGSTFATPVALQPLAQPRPSIDAIEPLEEGLPLIDGLPQPLRPSNSTRPRSDPDLRQLPNRLPAQVTIETLEYTHRTPNITPRQSSIAYSINALRPNLNVPPTIVPRASSRDYSAQHGLNIPHSGRGMSPISPSSPGGGVGVGGLNYTSKSQDSPASSPASKNGPSLNERRNNPSVPHIQTQLDGSNGARHPYEANAGPYPPLHSDATVVGGTLGFGRRPSHKRNHSSADVIQYQPGPAPIPAPVLAPPPAATT